MDERCTVLVSSCDAYSDVWTPFFTLLSANWRVSFPVRLITEKKDFFCALSDFKTIKAARGVKKTTWSERLIFALDQLETPYVLLLLEDFFMTAPVDQRRIEECIENLDKDKDAVCFSFFPTTGNEPSKYGGFDKRPQEGLYRFNAQAGLWRTKQLLSFLNPLEDAWQWENEGNRRSFKIKGDFYSISPNEKPIFPYDYMKHGLIGGRWFKDTKELFERAGIEFDFSKRGFFDEKYKALLPSVASSFVMEDTLYLDKGNGFCEEASLSSKQGRRTGDFVFEYKLSGYSGELRWDPSTKTGFAIENLSLLLSYESGKTEEVNLKATKTNGFFTDGAVVFLNDDPNIRFFTKRGEKAVTLTVSGRSTCPLQKSQIDAAYGKKNSSALYSIKRIFI